MYWKYSCSSMQLPSSRLWLYIPLNSSGNIVSQSVTPNFHILCLGSILSPLRTICSHSVQPEHFHSVHCRVPATQSWISKHQDHPVNFKCNTMDQLQIVNHHLDIQVTGCHAGRTVHCGSMKLQLFMIEQISSTKRVTVSQCNYSAVVAQPKILFMFLVFFLSEKTVSRS